MDATFGGGGHSRAILSHLDSRGHLYGIDQDDDALAGAPDDSRFTMIHGNFRFLRNYLRYYKIDAVDGVLADLGVSFHHLYTPERGFSFRNDGPLDMRMNRRSSLTASQIVNAYDATRLTSVLKNYGELPKAHKIADAIIARRNVSPFSTIGDLLQAVEPLTDPRRRSKELACIFQALRIEVNGELTALGTLLESAAKALRPGGRLAIITYHSLEDRLVKNFMKTGNMEGNVVADIYGRTTAPMRPLGSKPTIPNEDEIEANPRSRSAKLRVAVKL